MPDAEFNTNVEDGDVVADVVSNDPSPEEGNEALEAYQNIIPEEFAEKGHFKDIKDIDGLFKFADGLKNKLSSGLSGVPGEGATPEQIAQFNKDLGVPEEMTGYEFTPPEGGEFSDEEKAHNASMQKLMHESGVPVEMFSKLKTGLDLMQATIDETAAAETKRLDDEFDTMVSDVFGKDQKAQDTGLNEAKVLVDGYAKDSVKPLFNNLDNNSKIIIAATLKGIREEFIDEDSLPTSLPSASVKGSGTETEIRAELREVMSLPAYKDRFAGSSHKAAVEKKNEIMGRLAKVLKYD